MQTWRQSTRSGGSGRAVDAVGGVGGGAAPPHRARARARAPPPRPRPRDPPPTTPWRCAPSFTRHAPRLNTHAPLCRTQHTRTSLHSHYRVPSMLPSFCPNTLGPITQFRTAFNFCAYEFLLPRLIFGSRLFSWSSFVRGRSNQFKKPLYFCSC